MDDDQKIDKTRRGLVAACCAMGGVAGVAATGVVMTSLRPEMTSKKEIITADIKDLQPKQIQVHTWQDNNVWVMKRSDAMIASLEQTQSLVLDPQSQRTQYATTPDFAKNPWRSIKKDIFVFIPICTHLGCTVTSKLDAGSQPGLPAAWQGGFLCPCHGSTFDVAGRVFKDKPAADNLAIPPYHFTDDVTLVIGEPPKSDKDKT